MRQRDIVSMKDMEGKQQRKYAVKSIAREVMKIMKKHIGSNAEISQSDLFKKLFKTNMTDDLTDWFKWEFVKKAMHYCRTHTYCFIASRQGGHEWYYFVIEDNDDSDCYCDVLNKNINSMKKMMKKAKRAAKEKWYKKDWLSSGNPTLKKLS